jgi:hypothetical protein
MRRNLRYNAQAVAPTGIAKCGRLTAVSSIRWLGFRCGAIAVNGWYQLTLLRLLESRMHDERCTSGSARGPVKRASARSLQRTCPSILSSISAGVLGVAGIYLSEPVLVILAAVLLTVVRSQWVLAKAETTLRAELRENKDLNQESPVNRLFIECGKSPSTSLTFAKKVHLARKILNDRMTTSPTLIVSCLCLVLQVTMLTIPPLVVFLYWGR